MSCLVSGFVPSWIFNMRRTASSTGFQRKRMSVTCQPLSELLLYPNPRMAALPTLSFQAKGVILLWASGGTFAWKLSVGRAAIRGFGYRRSSLTLSFQAKVPPDAQSSITHPFLFASINGRRSFFRCILWKQTRTGE
jgi:hypothetical protein